MTTECIFCKIVAEEIPARKVYEDFNHVAFLELNPASKGHTLVVPKVHASTVYDLTRDQVQNLFAVVQLVGKKLQEELQPQKVLITVMGFHVDHAHVHLIPYYGGEMPLEMKNQEATPEELDAVAKKLGDSNYNEISVTG